MSAIVFDHLRFDTEAPTTHPRKATTSYCREEEFRSALNRYMAEYQKHNAITTDKRRCGPQTMEGNK